MTQARTRAERRKFGDAAQAIVQVGEKLTASHAVGDGNVVGGDDAFIHLVRNVSAQNKQTLGHYRCLAIAFIIYKNVIFYYAHKMWGKSLDGSCHYDDVTSRKVDNHGVCVEDADAGFGLAVGTARMTKDNVKRFTLAGAARGPLGGDPNSWDPRR